MLHEKKGMRMIHKNLSFILQKVSVMLLILFFLELSGCQLLVKQPSAKPAPTSVRSVFKLKVGSNEITIDDKPITLDAKIREINGSTYIPLRFLAEYLGAENLQYNPATEEITFSLTTYSEKKKESSTPSSK